MTQYQFVPELRLLRPGEKSKDTPDARSIPTFPPKTIMSAIDAILFQRIFFHKMKEQSLTHLVY